MKSYRHLFGLFAGSCLFLFACKEKQEQTRPTLENITESVYASGIVKSKNQYQVFATANGLIKTLLVTEGSEVKKGDPIVRISNETVQLQVENARLTADYAAVSANTDKLNALRLNIEMLKSTMKNDSMLLERQRNLWAQGIGARNELEQRELMYKNALTTYKAAWLQYYELQKQIAYSAQQSQKNLQLNRTVANDYIVKSEVDGKVYALLKEKGEMVNPLTPIAIIGDANDFLLDLQVDEYDIARIRLGQKVFITMDSYKGQLFECRVSKINPLMNESARSFVIEALFTTPPPTLYPNLTVEANILIRTKEKALTIPRDYLVNDSFVILSDHQKRKVTTGLKDYRKVEIRNGISPGDVILKPL